jgi:uncharacterized protein YndB with AHSA1/START domain
MVASTAQEGIQSLRVEKEILIAAPIDIAFEAILEEVGPASELPDGTPMPMVLEAWPGGRWFRDLGNQSGHFWGHVQVIKPPKLLEISGPLFMSYACANHLQYRLTAEGIGTKVTLIHRAFGEIPAEHRDGVSEGWMYGLKRVKEIAEKRLKSK